MFLFDFLTRSQRNPSSAEEHTRARDRLQVQNSRTDEMSYLLTAPNEPPSMVIRVKAEGVGGKEKRKQNGIGKWAAWSTECWNKLSSCGV
jgi:hypothetical protein